MGKLFGIIGASVELETIGIIRVRDRETFIFGIFGIGKEILFGKQHFHNKYDSDKDRSSAISRLSFKHKQSVAA